MSISLQKDQNMGQPTMSDTGLQSDVIMQQKHKPNSLFSVPGLFVGLTPKGLSDCDSVRSPTSPLDFRVFSNLGSSFRSPRSSSHEGHYKSWDFSKVGLKTIIDSPEDNTKLSGLVNPSSDRNNIIIGPRTRIKASNFSNHVGSLEAPKSLPNNYAIFAHAHNKSSNPPMEKVGSLFEIGEDPLEPEPAGKIWSCSLDSGMSFSTFNSSFANHKPILTSRGFRFETRVTQVDSAPQFSGVTPNFDKPFQAKFSSIPISIASGNRFIESLSTSENELSDDYTHVISYSPNPKTSHCWAAESSKFSVPFSLNNFLSFCYSCKKKLDGKDIYMYRGEKAFCSLSCRTHEILINEDEELEESINNLAENTPQISHQ